MSSDTRILQLIDRETKSCLGYEIKKETKKTKAVRSFDSKYWAKLGEISDLKLKRAKLSLRILLRNGLNDESGWEGNEEVKRVQEEEYIHSLEAEIFKKQASRLESNPSDEERPRRGYFMQSWKKGIEGLGSIGIEAERGDRPRNVVCTSERYSTEKALERCKDLLEALTFRRAQEQSRDNLIAVCNSKYPDPRSVALWCPILGHFIDGKSVHAVQIFPWTGDHMAISEVFGRENDIEEELNGMQNRIILSKYAKTRLDDGDIVLVPDVSDAASQEEMDAWSRSDPKEYKIRVANSEAHHMNVFYPGGEDLRRTWNSLDGRKVNFSSAHRPHARYLYWQYCVTMLRHSWKNKGTQAKIFWGVPGSYIKKRMLLAFAEQLGHDYEALMENAIVETEEDNVPESDPSAVLLASAQIRQSHSKYSYDSDVLYDSDDSDEDEESGDEVRRLYDDLGRVLAS